MQTPILNNIKTDVIQGHLPAAQDKLLNLGHKLGSDWIAMALITTIRQYIQDMMNSEDKFPSTIRVEVALATLDAHLDKMKYTFEDSAAKRIYLNQESSSKLDLPYFFHNIKDNSLKETMFVKLKASKIYKSTFPNSWDAGHKSILFPLMERRQSVMLESTTEPGWWKIISVVGG